MRTRRRHECCGHPSGGNGPRGGGRPGRDTHGVAGQNRTTPRHALARRRRPRRHQHRAHGPLSGRRRAPHPLSLRARVDGGGLRRSGPSSRLGTGDLRTTVAALHAVAVHTALLLGVSRRLRGDRHRVLPVTAGLLRRIPRGAVATLPLGRRRDRRPRGRRWSLPGFTPLPSDWRELGRTSDGWTRSSSPSPSGRCSGPDEHKLDATVCSSARSSSWASSPSRMLSSWRCPCCCGWPWPAAAPALRPSSRWWRSS